MIGSQQGSKWSVNMQQEEMGMRQKKIWAAVYVKQKLKWVVLQLIKNLSYEQLHQFC